MLLCSNEILCCEGTVWADVYLDFVRNNWKNLWKQKKLSQTERIRPTNRVLEKLWIALLVL